MTLIGIGVTEKLVLVVVVNTYSMIKTSVNFVLSSNIKIVILFASILSMLLESPYN